jgi:hypothetical protein
MNAAEPRPPPAAAVLGITLGAVSLYAALQL